LVQACGKTPFTTPPPPSYLLHTLTYTLIKRTKEGEELLRGFSYLSEEQASKEFSPQEGQLLHLHKRRRERDQEAQNERREREEAENERREREREAQNERLETDESDEVNEVNNVAMLALEDLGAGTDDLARLALEDPDAFTDDLSRLASSSRHWRPVSEFHR
jgi:hypothetical protein